LAQEPAQISRPLPQRKCYCSAADRMRKVAQLAFTVLTVPKLTTALVVAGPLDTPDLTPYNPIEVLCSLGLDGRGKPKIQKWCADWLQCIKTRSSPGGSAAHVMKAWKPADCNEVCGKWPVSSSPEGIRRAKTRAKFAKVVAKKKLFLMDVDSQDQKGCMKSCKNFQKSLSSCVANIMFEPGKIAAMGIPKKGQKKAPSICTGKDTPCQPDLEINHQKCLGHKTKATLDARYKVPAKVAQDCKFLKSAMDDCKSCPQRQGNYRNQYTTFVGGCMDQLNSYWQATHPHAGVAALPGASSCKVH